MELFEELKWRGLVKDVGGEGLEQKLEREKLTFYWGTDPTADSLHLGHYSSLVTAKRLQRAGHQPILLCGGATGLIGDPRPTAEREIMSKDRLEANLAGIRSQVDRIFGGKAQIVNNFDWMKDYTFLDFLRDIGKYINVNYMLSKEIISRRLETGITFAEFSYTLLQGYDFLWLYRNKGCVLQVEGADQWGNITTGLELIRKIEGKEAWGFTMPLVLDKQGHKFGKTAGNALWLDLNKTSSYELYQYLVNVDDSMVIDYLKIFTFLSVEEIEDLARRHQMQPEKREAHKALAWQIIADLHGSSEAQKALEASESLFARGGREGIPAGAPTLHIAEGTPLIDVLVGNSICSSKREARELLAAGAITINTQRVSDEHMELAASDGSAVLRRGKKRVYVLTFE